MNHFGSLGDASGNIRGLDNFCLCMKAFMEQVWRKNGCLQALMETSRYGFFFPFMMVTDFVHCLWAISHHFPSYGGSSGISDTRGICLLWGRPRFDPWIRKIFWRRDCNLLQYSCLENPRDGRTWRAVVHGVT